VVHPERKSIRRLVEQPGSVQAYEETLLYARVPGFARRLRREVDIDYKMRGPKYDEYGKEIEPGEVLAELVVPELEAEAKQKEAAVRQTEAEVEQALKAAAAAEATVAVAEAGVVETRANFERWDSESKRMTALTKDRVIDAQSRDETLNQFRAAGGRLASAQALVTKARADRDRSEADVRAARARVEVARADAQRAGAMLDYANIRAPYDGVVTWRKVQTGSFVQPAGGQGDWLFRVARLDPVRVVVAVPEADAELVKEKTEVKVHIQALPGPDWTGKVARTSWALEPGTRTLRVEADVPNKDGRLRPGMYVFARIETQLPEAWALPTSAVVKQGEAMVCFRIEDGKAVRTPVQVGRGDGRFTCVLRKQRPGTPSTWEEWTGAERIAEKASGLTDGQQVRVDPSPR
jgi:multidrug efflux pump subunit AcrA (membrane-fusion protein)